MRRPYVVTVIAFLTLPLVAGCGGHVPQPGTAPRYQTDAPIVWNSDVGGCNEPSHATFPEYQTVVPFEGEPTATKKAAPVYPDDARKAGVDGKVVLDPVLEIPPP